MNDKELLDLLAEQVPLPPADYPMTTLMRARRARRIRAVTVVVLLLLTHVMFRPSGGPSRHRLNPNQPCTTTGIVAPPWENRRTGGVVVAYFDGFDFTGFWDDDEYAIEEYVEDASPTDELIASLEAELGGYKLPGSYIALARMHNGGTPTRTCFPMSEPTGWAEDHVAVSGIAGIGRTKICSLGGAHGGRFWVNEWGYPDIGIYFADTPSAGHEMLALDYRDCGKDGEPCVVYVDQEADYRITAVAESFEAFVTGLVDEQVYDTSEADTQADLLKVREGSFSPILLRAFPAVADVLPDAPERMRVLAEAIVADKGHFSLHADERSMLMYDLLFWLFTQVSRVDSFEHYINRPKQHKTSYDIPSYELMIVFDIVAEPFGFCTGGYAPGFVKDWWDARVAAGDITHTPDGWRMAGESVTGMLNRLPQPNPAQGQP